MGQRWPVNQGVAGLLSLSKLLSFSGVGTQELPMLWEGSCQASGGRGGRGSYRKASLWEAIQSLSEAGMSRPLGLVECGVGEEGVLGSA